RYHQKAISSQKDGFQNALTNAIKAGEKLNLAKENIKAAKRSWLDWLRDEVKIPGTDRSLPQTTASLYMRLAKHKSLLQTEAYKKAIDEATTEGNLSIRWALNLLPKQERKSDDKDDDDEDEDQEDTTE